jgi:hypothetical protein
MVRIMKAVRLPAPGSIAFATLLSVMAPTATAATPEQDDPPIQLDGVRLVYGANDVPPLWDNATQYDATRADGRDSIDCAPSSGSAGEPAALRDGPRNRPFLAVLAAVPIVTYAAATGPRGSEILTPGDRFATSQLVGVGYVVNPRFRFGVMGIFNEALTGLPPAADPWQFGGIAPIAIGTFDHLIIGGGPIIGYRSGGKHQSDVGAIVLSGASIPLRNGLALNIAAPITALFVRRVTVSVGIAVGVAKVF